MLQLRDILNLNLDLFGLILIILESIQVVQVTILIHYQINLRQREALNLAMSTCSVEPFELGHLHEVLQNLPHILSQTRPIVIVVQR